jgi:hypothetical protein
MAPARQKEMKVNMAVVNTTTRVTLWDPCAVEGARSWDIRWRFL